jgi:hypothetical protein
MEPAAWASVLWIPEGVKDAMQQMQREEPRTHLAGGAVRDTLLAREVKDWDIFYPFGDKLNNNVLDRWMGKSECPVQEGRQYFDWHSGVMSVREHTVGGNKLNLIGMAKFHDVEENLARMDIGVCRVGVSPYGWHIVYGEGWQEDVRNNQLRLRRSDNYDQFLFSQKRLARLQKKYQDWDVVIDGTLTHFLNYEHKFDLDEIEF